MQLAIAFEKLSPPKNQRAAVLKMLIESNGVSERMTVFNGFRTRISELKRGGLNIRTIQETFITQFGKTSRYNIHFLMDGAKIEARELYEKINK